MRLIDADALKELIATNVYPVRDYFNSCDYGMFWTGGIEKAIDEMPTIEPERKKGKWIKAEYQDPIDIANGNFTYICTNCFHADISAESQEVPFCWHCGAKMGGKE